MAGQCMMFWLIKVPNSTLAIMGEQIRVGTRRTRMIWCVSFGTEVLVTMDSYKEVLKQ
jgi:hypothetical protein